MKLTTIAMLAAACVATTDAAWAASVSEVKWINQCIDDNADEGASQEVVLKYCTCMNNKMDANETKSITEWEKTHETEANDCADKAGWK